MVTGQLVRRTQSSIRNMARKKGGTLEDMIKAASLLPWWLGASLAVLSYVALHWYAGSPVPKISDPTKVAELMGPAVWRGFASVGQYFVPTVFGLGAGLSAWQSHRRKSLFGAVAANPVAGLLNDMNWREFELLVGEAYRQRGYKVLERGGNGPDGGVDLVLRKGAEVTVVQCKQYRSTRVGVAIVRELFGAMTAEGASEGKVVSLGTFTADARSFARGRNIELVTGSDLQALIEQGRGSSGSTLERVSASSIASIAESNSSVFAPGGSTCPQCGSPMVRRVAKAGVNIGKSFWGCSRFPHCRGTRAINN